MRSGTTSFARDKPVFGASSRLASEDSPSAGDWDRTGNETRTGAGASLRFTNSGASSRVSAQCCAPPRRASVVVEA
jgi:hypothetical protein